MPSQIDHVIVGVRDLAQASADFTAAGFTMTPGGEHTDGGTHNALIAFADTTYLELIAAREPIALSAGDLQDDPLLQQLARGEGFLGFALRTEDASAEATALRLRGLHVLGPETGGRDRPDGQHVAWRGVMVEGTGPLPFLVEDLTPRSLRIPDGAAARHPLGVTRLLGLALVVNDLAATKASLAALVVSSGAPVTPAPDGAGAALRFTVGPHTIDLLAPSSAESELGRALLQRGPSPYAITLSGPGTEMNTSMTLPLAQTHGARIRIVGTSGL